MSEARVIQIRPLANSGAPIWDYIGSLIRIIRNMEVGYERK